MSSFQCNVVRVTIEPHPNADAIELARVGGYLSVVKKNQFRTGDLAVYIPEMAVLPEWLLKRMGFWDDLNGKGKLSTSAGNRVRAMKLRGVLSQGLVMDLRQEADGSWAVYPETEEGTIAHPAVEGEDLAELLGIIKWEPVIPMHMRGKVAGGDLDATIGYDFEALKKHPDLFDDGQEVVITEKIHGTLLQVGLIPKSIWEGKSWAEKCPTIGESEFKGIVTSKGQGAKGLMLDPNDEHNLYVAAATALGLWDKLEFIRFGVLGHPIDKPLFIFGELFGVQQTEGGAKGIQDLTYGQSSPVFNAFDIYAGTRDDGFYLTQDLFDQACSRASIRQVPQLYRGPFSQAVVQQHTDGNTVVQNITRAVIQQIREGVVVKAVDGIRHPRLGRRIAKSVSEAYLLRRDATEYS